MGVEMSLPSLDTSRLWNCIFAPLPNGIHRFACGCVYPVVVVVHICTCVHVCVGVWRLHALNITRREVKTGDIGGYTEDRHLRYDIGGSQDVAIAFAEGRGRGVARSAHLYCAPAAAYVRSLRTHLCDVHCVPMLRKGLRRL
eukprot:TRINITY_DN1833_c0_g1_i1.p1 TRINITY_DN1833_c0_g1~~TRINITY_DN1833_c0_g1_i1.p1  ORF type:complete len:142 (-),score=10.76 TRINITY_DN1833_c0_g1_i1:51-476(-)